MMQFNALLFKELKEAFRDKRALAAALMLALMAPVMIFAISKMAIKEAVEKPDIFINVTGAEYAPKLIEAMAKENILLLSDVPQDKQTLWQERDVRLTIPESFAEDMVAGKQIKMTLSADYSDNALRSPLRRIKNTINGYSRNIGYRRMMVRGIDVKLMQPINLIEFDEAVPSSNAMFISMLLGIYLLMAAFMSGLSVAIDSSAGERERNVLEVILCQPVKTLNIVLAKLSCASLIAVIGVVLTLVLTSVAVSFIDLTTIGATFTLDGYTIAVLVALLLPICLFASALQLFFAFQAKSFKEAQSTVSMIIILPALIPAALTFIQDKPKWLEWAPISGQYLLMEDLFKAVPINMEMLFFTGVVTLVMTVVLVQTMAKKLTSEKTVLALS
ncbi:ABC transporter permease [Thalassotalea agarivorans]|uniref:Sodium transport system permease protein n=1 Tax=Thalassotalea agarivorans TaxID=349064 RepID=A0A1I0ANG0_THASX|nr:ABC transporter permease [Thalassotalea agarivorans]SES95852.1 sodium transport system permease protein [Thalassotalea agarivorans]